MSEEKTKARPRGAQEYKGNGKHDWETVQSNDVALTHRLRVPGGWLYRTTTAVHEQDFVAVNTTFVPAPEVIGYAI